MAKLSEFGTTTKTKLSQFGVAEDKKTSVIENIGKFFQAQFPEVVEEATGRSAGLVPKELTEIGAKIKEKITAKAPSFIKRGLETAVETAVETVRGGVLSAVVPGGRTTIEKPITAATVGSIIDPKTRVPAIAGLASRLAVQQIVPPEVTPVPGIAAEVIGAGATGLIRGGFRSIARLKKTAGVKTAAKQTLRELDDDIINLRSLKTEQTQAIGDKALRIKDSINANINKVSQTIKDKLPQLTGEAAEAMQKKLVNFFREGSESYGKHIDDMVENMSTVMKNRVTRQKVIDLIRDSIAESENAFIKEGRGFQALQDLLEKYSKTAVTDITGRFKKIGKVLNVKDVITDLKNIKKLISPGARTGASRLSADDIPIEILRKNIGGLLENVTKGQFGKLNESYRKFLDVVKTSNRVFKPFKGALETKQGAALLERVSKGTATKSERDLLTSLEKGKPGLAKGIGRVETEATEFVKARLNRIETLTKQAKNLKPAQRNATRDIAKRINNEISSKKITIEEVGQVLSDAERAEKFLRRIGVAAGTTALASIPLLKRIFGEKAKFAE